MKFIFIHGPAASGKYTVGKALQEITGFRLFHNHLVVDALLAVFQFGSGPFVRLREEMWLAVFKEAAERGVSLIFTFAPESTVHPTFIDKTITTITERGGRVHFVALTCSIEEQERRIENPSRAQFLKLRSLTTLRELRATNAMHFPPLPAGVSIDTGTMPPTDSARRICEFFSLPMIEGGSKIENYPKSMSERV